MIACGRCVFGLDTLLEPSYASVLMFSDANVNARHLHEFSKHVVIPGATSFCVKCRQTTFITRSHDFSEAAAGFYNAYIQNVNYAQQRSESPF